MIIVFFVIATWMRWPLFTQGTAFYNADTAILDLMSLHFSRGEGAFYYWGQGYYGVLDSVLLMPLFKLLEFSPLTSQLLPLIGTLLFIGLFYVYVKRTTDLWTACLAGAALAVGSPYLLRTGFTSYCYVFLLIFGVLALLFHQSALQQTRSKLFFGAYGVLIGFSWYYFRLVIVFYAGILCFLFLSFMSSNQVRLFIAYEKREGFEGLWKRYILLENSGLQVHVRRFCVVANVVFLVNTFLSLFLWVHGDFISRIAGHPVKVFFSPTFKLSLQLAFLPVLLVHRSALKEAGRALPHTFPAYAMGVGFLIGYSPALLGMITGHAPSSPGGFVTFLGLVKNLRVFFGQIVPLLLESNAPMPLRWCIWLVFMGGNVWLGRHLFRGIAAWWYGKAAPELHPLVLAGAANLLLGFFCMDLVDQWTGRYFLPYYVVVLFGAAQWCMTMRRSWRMMVIPVFCAGVAGSGIATQRLLKQAPRPAAYAITAAELVQAGYDGGYADYWVAYQITSLSREKIILTPSGNNDRFKPYLDFVRNLKQIVLVGQAVPVGTVADIKGVSYKALEIKTMGGLAVTVMQKIG